MALVDVETTRAAVTANLFQKRRDLRGAVFQAVLLLTLLMSVAILIVLLTSIVTDAWPTLQDRGTDFVTQGLAAKPEDAGVWQGVLGSFVIMLFVILLAFPVGLAAAIYLEEYARDSRFTRLVNVNIRNLAGVPSVVYGLLGLAIFVNTLGNVTGGDSILAAGLTIAILVLPIVIITSAEAIRAVPTALREAGYGLGATQWEVIRGHVLPYAAPGILTGTVLSLARALGEAAPLILIGADTFYRLAEGTPLLDRLQGPFTALPYIVFDWSRNPSKEFREIAAAAIFVMLVVLLAANAAAILLRNHYEKRRSA